MRSTLSSFSFVFAAATLIFTSTAIAQERPSKWIDFGRVGTTEKLQLDVNNIRYTQMPIDDRQNLEGMTGEDIKNAKIPMRDAISFTYKIGGRTRFAYTVSCKGKNLAPNPTWRTSTTTIDYWPQYFSVPADSPASRQMLKNVCGLATAK
jgi:hypothetical protein